jgi:hypothetical protein
MIQRVLADNDPAEQEKLIKFNTLLANLVIFHTPWTSWTWSAAWSPRAGSSPPASSAVPGPRPPRKPPVPEPPEEEEPEGSEQAACSRLTGRC